MQRPEPEVIVNFADGLAYNKGKLESALFGGSIFSSHSPAKKEKDPKVKDEDVNLIVRELEIPKADAERALSEVGGDLDKALRTLIGLHD